MTGQRTSQIAELNVGDLQPGATPKLLMPSSLKGRNRTQRTRKPVPIPPGLAKRLQQAAAKRDAAEPLLLREDGARWRGVQHYTPIRGSRQGCRAAGWRDDLRAAAHRNHAGAAGQCAGQAGRVESSTPAWR